MIEINRVTQMFKAEFNDDLCFEAEYPRRERG